MTLQTSPRRPARTGASIVNIAATETAPSPRRSRRRGMAPALALAAAALAVAGCGSHRDASRSADTASAGGSIAPEASRASGSPARVAEVGGFKGPEAIVYDSARDVFFVSNVNGSPGMKDGNGFISELGADGKVIDRAFIGNGKNGVTLNSPMGSRVRGDTLWLVDVDKLYAFDARSGKRLTTVDFAPLHAKFLNDLTFGPNGTIYVTDMGMTPEPSGQPKHTGPDRILEVGRDHKPRVALESKALSEPDGIVWEASARRFIITPFGGKAVMTWSPGDKAPKSLAPGGGKFDGIEVEGNGDVLLTSWNDSTVYRLSGDSLARVTTAPLASPSDVTMDTRHHRLAISLMMPGKVIVVSAPEQQAANQ